MYVDDFFYRLLTCWNGFLKIEEGVDELHWGNPDLPVPSGCEEDDVDGEEDQTLKLHSHGNFAKDELVQHGQHVDQVQGALHFTKQNSPRGMNTDHAASFLTPFEGGATEEFANSEVAEEEGEKNCRPHGSPRLANGLLPTTHRISPP